MAANMIFGTIAVPLACIAGVVITSVVIGVIVIFVIIAAVFLTEAFDVTAKTVDTDFVGGTGFAVPFAVIFIADCIPGACVKVVFRYASTMDGFARNIVGRIVSP